MRGMTCPYLKKKGVFSKTLICIAVHPEKSVDEIMETGLPISPYTCQRAEDWRECPRSSQPANYLYKLTIEPYNKGIAFFSLGKFEEAIEFFLKTLMIWSEHYPACNNIGYALNRLGRFQEALQYLDKALEIYPDYVHAWNNKGVSLAHLGRSKKAIKCFEKATEIDPTYVQAWTGKGNVLYGEGVKLRDHELIKEAVEYYDNALDIDDRCFESWHGKCSALFELGKIDESLVCVDRALEINPRSVDTLMRKGGILIASKQYEEALRVLDRVLEINPKSVQAWHNKAVASIRIFNETCNPNRIYRFADASLYVNKALDIDQNFELAQKLKRQIQKLQAEFERAVELEAAEGCTRTAADVHFYLAVIYFRSGRYDSAWKHVRIAQKLGTPLQYINPLIADLRKGTNYY